MYYRMLVNSERKEPVDEFINRLRNDLNEVGERES